MTNDDKSLGDQHTFDGEPPENLDNSLGDEMTYAGQAAADPSSLGDEMTFGGDAAGLDDDLYDDQMEIVDLESRYTTEGVLGKGGMGEVLLATDTRLERKVAIKRILGKAARSRTAVNRFLTEAKSVAAINHPNIVQIYDYGRATDGPFLIMECVEGSSLLERCRHGAIPLEESIDMIVQLCDGLAKAHAAGIIHRDIKPANILLTVEGEPKLTDFGLAKAEAADTGMTMAGAVLGTLDFMPPEQRKDAALVDARSDLWSLAATLYQMVTGKSPKIIKFNDVPQSLQGVLGKALEDEKDDRYQSASDFKEALLASRSGTAEVELEEGDCPHCGTQNPTTRKFCRNPECGESLEVPCLSCSSKIPMWEQVCDSCGAKQRELLAQRRTEMASSQAKAESLLKTFDFERARAVTVAMRDEADLRLTHLKGWAEQFLIEIEKDREQELNRLADLMNEAIKHQQAHDYSAGLRTLDQIPKVLSNTALPGHDQTVNALRAQLQSTLDEIKRLDTLIRQRVKNRELTGLLAEVEQLQRLQPGRDNLEKLAKQLTDRNRKLSKTRDEALAEAKKRLASQDYDGCVLQLQRIDASLVDAEIESLRETAGENLHQVNKLRDSINLAFQNKQLDGLLPTVEQCLALQADATDLQKLRDQLIERENRNASVIAKAEELRQACQFEQAVAMLQPLGDTLVHLNSNELLFDCENLRDSRVRAVQAMKQAGETGEFDKALTANQQYHQHLAAAGLYDGEFEKLKTACQQQLADQQESERAAKRQKVLYVRIGIGAAAAVLIGIVFVIVLWVQSSMRAAAITAALGQRNYKAVLAMDPENAAALEMAQKAKRENDIRAALAINDYEAALQINPKYHAALVMKKEADIKKALSTGNYGKALALDPNNAQAVEMKKQANIKEALAQGDYQAALKMDRKNAAALAMVRETNIKEALAKGDFQAALALDPKNADALAQKKNRIQELAKSFEWSLAKELSPELKIKKNTIDFKAPVLCFAQSSQDRKQAFGCWDGSVRVLDYSDELMTGKEILQLAGHDQVVFGIDIDPNRNRIVTCSADKSAVIWDLGTGRRLHTFDKHDGWVHSVAFSPDGNKIITGSDDGFVRIWDISSAEVVFREEFQNAVVLSVAYSPDGKKIACATSNGIMHLWNETAGTSKVLESAHRGPIMSLAFSPDSNQLASGSWDKTIRVWDTTTGTQLMEPLLGHNDWINSIAYSPDGKNIVSGSVDTTIRVWDAASGVPRKGMKNLLAGHRASVNSVRFSPDGKSIISAGTDKTLRYWKLDDHFE